MKGLKNHLSLILIVSLTGQLCLAQNYPALPGTQDSADKPVVQDFLRGMRAYEAEPTHYELDPGTASDLELDQVGMALMGEHPWTPLGLNHMYWLLRHPSQDVSYIQQRQKTIAKMAEDEELLKSLSQFFEGLYNYGSKDWKDGKYNESNWFQVFNQTQFWDRDYTTGKDLKLRTTLLSAGILAMVGSVGMNLHTFSKNPLAASATLLGLGVFNWFLFRNDHKHSEAGIQQNIMVTALEQSDKILKLIDRSGIPELQKISNVCEGECGVVTRKVISISLGDGYGANIARIAQARNVLKPIARAVVHFQKDKIAKIMGMLGELEVLTRMAMLYRDNRERMTFPLMQDSPVAQLEMEEGHHPMIALKKEVSTANSVEFSNDPHLLATSNFTKTGILTGPNTGGKTTFLRTIGTNLILAQLGFPVFAKRFEATPIQVRTIFTGRSDSTLDRSSTFKRQADILSEIFGLAKQGKNVLFLADEIATGTSVSERSAIEKGVVTELHENYPNVLIMLATHERTTANLEAEGLTKRPGFQNFQVSLHGHAIVPGASQVYNAADIMEASGVPEEVINRVRGIHSFSFCERELKGLTVLSRPSVMYQ